MKYTMILWPHSNARYRSETLKLAKSELNVMFARVASEAEVSGAECLDLPAISIRRAAFGKRTSSDSARISAVRAV